MQWETVIGLEVHAQLNTQSKIFSGSATTFGSSPNSQADLVDLAMPGTLPVLNRAVVEKAVLFGLAIDATINHTSVFERKNYFYPDLPKGYQTSQLAHPIVGAGHLVITLASGEEKKIRITRAHLEEDAGKSLHGATPSHSGIDLNRAGTPLLEIVSEPDLRSSSQAISYLKNLHQLVRYIGICDGSMQEGSFRCDVNLSLRPKGQTALGVRTELKNINSFRFIERAIASETERQMDILESGGSIIQETRLYDAERDETRPMRSKEEANDYRYFPCPDLLPLTISDDYILGIKKSLPELPGARCQRFIKEYGLTENDAKALTNERGQADYFEALVKSTAAPTKLAFNWMNAELAKALNAETLTIEQTKVTAKALAHLLDNIHDNTVSGHVAKQVFQTMWHSGDSAEHIIERDGLKQVTDFAALDSIIKQVLSDNPTQLAELKAGKDKLLGFFVGQIMKQTKGQANPKTLNERLKAAIFD